QLTGSEVLHREIFNLIKEFDGIEYLDIGIKGNDNEMLREMMVDSYFLDLTESCKFLYLDVSESVCEKITPEALHKLYKNMADGSTKFRNLAMKVFDKDQCISFLELIGIIFKDDQFYSNKDIEVYELKYTNGSLFSYSLFDGYLEIMIDGDLFDFGDGVFVILLHETRDSLEKAKKRKGFARIEISPE
ncbi:hypothetical protein PENTCL1PPCAC_19552, partial [Pristionchus entomophagus]